MRWAIIDQVCPSTAKVPSPAPGSESERQTTVRVRVRVGARARHCQTCARSLVRSGALQCDSVWFSALLSEPLGLMLIYLFIYGYNVDICSLTRVAVNI